MRRLGSSPQLISIATPLSTITPPDRNPRTPILRSGRRPGLCFPNIESEELCRWPNRYFESLSRHQFWHRATKPARGGASHQRSVHPDVVHLCPHATRRAAICGLLPRLQSIISSILSVTGLLFPPAPGAGRRQTWRGGPSPRHSGRAPAPSFPGFDVLPREGIKSDNVFVLSLTWLTEIDRPTWRARGGGVGGWPSQWRRRGLHKNAEKATCGPCNGRRRGATPQQELDPCVSHSDTIHNAAARGATTTCALFIDRVVLEPEVLENI